MNKYLSYLEKQSSFTLAALAAAKHIGAVHLLQNVTTKAAIGRPATARYIANGFANGTKGLAATGVKATAKQAVLGGIAPEIAAMRLKANQAGHAMKPILDNSTKREQVGMRLLSQGNIPKIIKLGLHKHPLILEAAKQMDQYLGTSSHAVLTAIGKAIGKSKNESVAIREAAKRKDLPLLNNIVANISRGKVDKVTRPGIENAKSSVAGAVGSAVLDPVAGGFNTAKSIMASKTLQKSKYGKVVSTKLEDIFVNHPAKAGFKQGGKPTLKQKAGNFLYENGVNSVSGNIKRTAAALKVD